MTTKISQASSLKITNEASKPVVWLYGTIGDEYGGITANDFLQALNTIPSKQPIDLRIHSDGGSWMDGIAMNSIIRQRAGAVDGFVDGLAASAASALLMGCSTITMAANAWQMAHGASVGGPPANEADTALRLEMLRQINQDLFQVYSRRWNGKPEDLKAIIQGEKWFTAEQAVEVGFADKIDAEYSIAAKVNTEVFSYKQMPDSLKPVAGASVDKSATQARVEARLAEIFGTETPQEAQECVQA